MSVQWFFYIDDKNVVQMRARAEGPGGMIGDAFHEVAEGDEDFFGVSYDEMMAQGGGVVEVSEDGVGKLKKV